MSEKVKKNGESMSMW